jgi:hypothetical protein
MHGDPGTGHRGTSGLPVSSDELNGFAARFRDFLLDLGSS